MLPRVFHFATGRFDGYQLPEAEYPLPCRVEGLLERVNLWQRDKYQLSLLFYRPAEPEREGEKRG